jgi:hypothetical protein
MDTLPVTTDKGGAQITIRLEKRILSPQYGTWEARTTTGSEGEVRVGWSTVSPQRAMDDLFAGRSLCATLYDSIFAVQERYHGMRSDRRDCQC